jgi:hypothetical protein
MTIKSENVLDYIEGEILDWISNPVFINAPRLLFEHEDELEISPLPNMRIWFKIHNWDEEYPAIQWGLDVPKNQDYLPENENADEFIQKIQNIIVSSLHTSLPDEYSSDDMMYMEPRESKSSNRLSFYSAATPLDLNKLGQNIESMELIEISSKFGNTSIYLDAENPDDSLDELLRYNNLDDVYDIIFQTPLDKELNIHIS